MKTPKTNCSSKKKNHKEKAQRKFFYFMLLYTREKLSGRDNRTTFIAAIGTNKKKKKLQYSTKAPSDVALWLDDQQTSNDNFKCLKRLLQSEYSATLHDIWILPTILCQTIDLSVL